MTGGGARLPTWASRLAPNLGKGQGTLEPPAPRCVEFPLMAFLPRPLPRPLPGRAGGPRPSAAGLLLLPMLLGTGGCALVGYEPLPLDGEAVVEPPDPSGAAPAPGEPPPVVTLDAGPTPPTPLPATPPSGDGDGVDGGPMGPPDAGLTGPMPPMPPMMDAGPGQDASTPSSPCIPGAMRCEGDQLLTCDPTGQAETSQDCTVGAGVCEVGGCTAGGCTVSALPDLTECGGGTGVCRGGACEPAGVCTAGTCDSRCRLQNSCASVCLGDATCNLDCNWRTSCAADCTDSSLCDATCNGASCDLRCSGNGTCAATCDQNAVCEIHCSGTSDCTDIRCENGSACRLQCEGSATCAFASCHGTTRTCPDGSIVCDQLCP